MNLDKLTEFTKKALTRSHFLAYFDTLKYLAKGGRIGKAKGLLGSVLPLKHFLTVKEGEMTPVSRFRSKAAAIEYMYNYMESFKTFESVSVEHSTDMESADTIAKRFSEAHPKIPMMRSAVSPVLGAYGGPNAIAVTVLEAEGK
jgi:DegV family protein with EDD domain